MDKDINDNKPQYQTACRGTLKNPTNYPKAAYRGTEVYFCTLACIHAFEQDPDPFMAGEVKHPINKGTSKQKN